MDADSQQSQSQIAPIPSPSARNPTLVCFAVKEEAKYFHAPPNTRVLITGMGRHNAYRRLEQYFEKETPSGVLTCGFAGGLNPKLEVAEIVYDVDENAPWEEKLLASVGKRIRFESQNRIACTANEKFKLWQLTGMDAVEMESATIRQVCQRKGIPSATIRVISDSVHQNLPLDFNRLLTPDTRIDFAKLSVRLMFAPRKIAELLRFQSQTVTAAQALDAFLEKLLSSKPQTTSKG